MSVKQLVCRCGAYAFPHRVGGGACPGRRWALRRAAEYGRRCAECGRARLTGWIDGWRLEPVFACGGGEGTCPPPHRMPIRESRA